MSLVFDQKNDDICYNALFKRNISPMLLIDIETLMIADANDAACFFYQYSYEDMLKLKISDINMLTEDQLLYKMRLAEKQITNNFIFKHRTSTGEIKSVSVNSGMVSINDRIFLHSTVHDISDRRDAVDEIFKLSSQIQIMLDNLPFNAWFKDLQGKYTAVNRPFEDETGLLKEEILGKSDYDIWPEAMAERCLSGDAQVMSERQKIHFEERMKDGKWIETYKSPIVDEYGNVIGITGLSRDITERIVMQEALHDAEQRQRQMLEEMIEMKDNFITMITHEFKTPIAIINAALQMMEISCKNEMSTGMKKYIKKIKQNSLRQQRLVDNLLDVTRIRAGQMKVNPKNIEIVSFTKEIVESVKLYAEQKDLKLSFRSDFSHKVIPIDEEKYDRIVLNLLSNAIKFTPPQKSIAVRLSLQEGFIKLTVRDQGVGIPEENQHMIFEQFGRVDDLFSRQAEGTGIGLYLVKLLVQELGGTIALKSRIDCGSSFTILLPAPVETEQNIYNQIHPDLISDAASLELSDIIF